MLDYDIDGWDTWLSLLFFVVMFAFLIWRFHIFTPIDQEHE